MTLYKLLKRAAVAVLGVVALVVVAYAALIIVNFEDEVLSPAAQAFAAAAARKVPDDQNGYFAVQGMYFSPEGGDPHADGLKMFARAAARQRKGDYRTDPSKYYLPRPKAGELCEASAPCLARVRADRTAIEFQLAKHETLRQRIREFVRIPRYEVPYLTYPGTFLMMGDTDFHMIRTLGGTESAYAWASGRQGEAIVLVAERIAMARRILREPNELYSVLLAAIWLRDEYRLLAEFTHDDPAAARRHYAQIEPLLRPLPDDEVRATHWVHGEFERVLEENRAIAAIPKERRIALGYFLLPNASYADTDGYEKNLPWWFDPAAWLLSPLYQPIATINRFEPDYARLATAIGGGPRTVAELLAKSGDPAPRHSWSVYNPIGAVIDVPGYAGYVKRLNDAFRFMRLVGIQGALLNARVPLTDVDAYLASSALAVDPVTGRRVGWDAARARLHLDALEPARPTGDVAGQLSVNYKP